MSMTGQLKMGPLQPANQDASKVFDVVKDDVLKKIRALFKADDVHDLNEVHKLEYIKTYELVSYRVEDAPYGLNYYGKVLLNDKGDCVHVRAFCPGEGKGPVKFHSIKTRLATEGEAEGGAIFTLEDPLRRFEY